MNETETEKLLKGINLTFNEIYDIVRKGVSNRYRAIKQLRAYTTIEDLTQSVLLFYFDKMGEEIRLNHYIKKYNDKEHIINLIKKTSYQLPLYYARQQKVIAYSNQYSLDYFYNNGEIINLEELIEDTKATNGLTSKIMAEDFTKVLRKELRRINYRLLKNLRKRQYHNKAKFTETIKAQLRTTAKERTEAQLNIIRDLCMGYYGKEIRKKYKSFNTNMRIIKSTLRTITYKYNMGSV